ncbi:hypothetical protein BV25DRAFT_1833040 [Artomyces pyxidatus]|uniref:Uncharacterized protein n=1 Tax=Artomyces pyxidatus TaxID=48021 RepID=A0ACB8SH84_9AGAM|nr:hypothetical protein BV25DRAFT_1833040 [Artomyces pyxidatus]
METSLVRFENRGARSRTRGLSGRRRCACSKLFSRRCRGRWIWRVRNIPCRLVWDGRVWNAAQVLCPRRLDQDGKPVACRRWISRIVDGVVVSNAHGPPASCTRAIGQGASKLNPPFVAPPPCPSSYPARIQQPQSKTKASQQDSIRDAASAVDRATLAASSTRAAARLFLA